MRQSIPKIIHYCWFGNNEKDKSALMRIQQWKRILTDYEIIEWNEDKFNIKENIYTRQAYDNKKWAFVSDYVRLYALYNYGGIYLDTDVEVTNSLDKFLYYRSFTGFQSDKDILTAVIGSERKSYFIEELLKLYINKNFIKNGEMDLMPNNILLTEFLVKKYGLKQDNTYQLLNNYIHVFPKSYFSTKINRNANYTIHLGNSSWMSKETIINNLKKYRNNYNCLLDITNKVIENYEVIDELVNAKVGIYGNGELGHVTHKILKRYNCNIKYIVDEQVGSYRDVDVVKPSTIKNDEIDYLIITPINYFNNIIENLDGIIEKNKIILINEIFKNR
ncbi:MAG: glycosyl transferase [Clostridium lundense]|nr:glycosyl transferase [Clostridium lundense]